MPLSSSEMEYVALSEAFTEVMHVIQLLGCMKISFQYPVMVTVDNVDAIFVASILLLHVIPSTWVTGTSMLIIMLKTELLR